MEERSVVILDKNKIVSASSGQIRIYDDQKRLLRSIPIFLVGELLVHIENKITSSLLKKCSRFKIPIHLIDKTGRYHGSFLIGNGKNIFLREQQYLKRKDLEFVLSFSKSLVLQKILNQATILKSMRKNLSTLIENFHKITTKGTLLGVEGKAANYYWKSFGSLIKTKDFKFISRSKNPPKDEINSLLSYGYALLASKMVSLLFQMGLDPYFGFYHEINYRRPSLALDFMEEFRPLAVDKLVIYLVNKRIIQKGDFQDYHGIFFLKGKPKNIFVKKWLEWWFEKKFFIENLKKSMTLQEIALSRIKNFSRMLIDEKIEYQILKFS